MHLDSTKQLTVLALVSGLLMAMPAASEVAFETTITGDQAVPPTSSGAYGTATIILSDDGTQAAYTVIFAGLEGTQTGAHFHNAEPGEDGPVVFDLGLGSPLSGFWSPSVSEAAELMAGRIYVNIHSDLFPTGEIRGNFHLTQVPAESTSWGKIKALYH